MDTDSTGRRQTGFSRRRLLGGAAAVGGGLAVAGIAGHVAAEPAAKPPPLQALTTAEADLVGAMADRIFPADGSSPGATEIGVVSYLDAQLAGAWGRGDRFYADGPIEEPTDYGHGYQLRLTPAELYKQVLPRIEAEAKRRFGGTAFADASAAQQDALMKDLEAGKVDLGLADGEFGYTSASFFSDFLANVKEGLFADPMYHGNRQAAGWKWIDYPGDPMAYGDIYYATFGRPDDRYSVTPKGMGEMG